MNVNVNVNSNELCQAIYRNRGGIGEDERVKCKEESVPCHNVTSYYVQSCYVVLCHIMSCHVMSCHNDYL